MPKTVFYVLPWIVGAFGIIMFMLRDRRLNGKEKGLLLLIVLPLIGNWVAPAFLGVGIHDYRYYHWITAVTALPIGIWMLLECVRRIMTKTLRLPRLIFYEKALLLFIPAGILAQLVGIIRGNALKYLISDAYKWFLFPLFYVFLSFVLSAARTERLLTGFYKLNLGLVTTSCLFILWTIILGDIQKIDVAGAEIVLPLLLVANFGLEGFRASTLGLPFRRRTTVFLLMAMTVLGGYFSQERALWLTFITGLIAAAIFVAARHPFRQILKIPLSSVVSIVLLVLLVIGINSIHSGFLKIAVYVAQGRAETGFHEIVSDAPRRLLSKRITEPKIPTAPPSGTKPQTPGTKLKEVEIVDKSRLGSLEWRVLEVVDSWNYMKSADWWPKYVIGMGDGAQYKVVQGFETSAASDERTGWNHNFHFAFMGVFFTKGAMGLAVLFAFLAGLFFVSYRAIKPAQNGRITGSSVVFPAYFVTLILAFLYYFGGGSMLYDMPFIFYAAVFGILFREQRKRDASAPKSPFHSI
jgi:hypothetical protein